MPSTTLDIKFAADGVIRRIGYRSASGRREPFPTPWAVNVRLEDSLTNRLRGGSFTGASPDSIDPPRYLDLVTENGDGIVTENGDQIVLGPQYGVATGHGRVWVTPGDDAPDSGTGDCLYRDRLFRTYNNEILASRQGDNTDWDYSADVGDTGRAVAFQLSEAGEVGASVVALVPHKDSFLICFTATSTWIVSGDPTTGTLRNVSREVGIIAPRAWCKNHDTVYFMSSLGLYAVGANGSGLQAVSEDRIPEELTGVVDADCVLGYTHSDRGVSIHLTSGPSWFYDVEREGFWPFDTTETDSHVLLGPFHLGDLNSFGRILRLYGITAAGSADVTWRIVLGDTAEEAASNGKAAIEASLAGNDFSSYVHSSGTWSAGINNSAYPRSRGMWMVLWLSSASTWAYEGASMNIQNSGRWK